MTRKILTEAELRAAAKAKQDLGEVELWGDGRWDTKVKAVDGESRALDFVISTGSVDRMGDTVAADGWKLTNFRKNPVVLWAHDNRIPPIGRASSVRVKDGKLKARVTFAEGKMDPTGLAEQVLQMLKEGFLSATSVGFMPLKWNYVESNAKRPYGIDFVEQELLEFSVVTVPANAEALVEARAKGINIGPMLAWAESVVKSHGSAVIPTADLDFVLRAARDSDMGARILRLFGTSAEQQAIADRLKAAAGGGEIELEQRAALPDPAGDCGRADDKLCGMREPIECKTHAAVITAMALEAPALLKLLEARIKAGRTLSAKNETDLRAAVDLLMNVLAAVDPPAEGEGDKSAGDQATTAAEPTLLQVAAQRRAAANRHRISVAK